MLEVKIKNHLLNETIEFLFEIPLKGKQSRHRTRFIRVLNDHLEQVSEEQKELLKQHCNLDEEGNPKTKNDGKEYDVKDLDSFVKDRQELLNEELVVDDSNSQVMLKTVRDILDSYDDELSGRKAVLYEHLCEIFKVDEEIEREPEEE